MTEGIGAIESLSRELLERLIKEEGRPVTTGPSPLLLGGVVKVGVELEALLRAVVSVVADTDGVDPGTLLAPTSGRRPPLLHNAMAGQPAGGSASRSTRAHRSARPCSRSS